MTEQYSLKSYIDLRQFNGFDTKRKLEFLQHSWNKFFGNILGKYCQLGDQNTIENDDFHEMHRNVECVTEMLTFQHECCYCTTNTDRFSNKQTSSQINCERHVANADNFMAV